MQHAVALCAQGLLVGQAAVLLRMPACPAAATGCMAVPTATAAVEVWGGQRLMSAPDSRVPFGLMLQHRQAGNKPSGSWREWPYAAAIVALQLHMLSL